MRKPQRGHNDTPFVFGVFVYYELFLNMVCLTVALACDVQFDIVDPANVADVSQVCRSIPHKSGD
jgi:hypothetical protein